MVLTRDPEIELMVNRIMEERAAAPAAKRQKVEVSQVAEGSVHPSNNKSGMN